MHRRSGAASRCGRETYSTAVMLAQSDCQRTMDVFIFCEASYQEVGRDSYFAPVFNRRGDILAEARCDMYTDNMRQHYVLACRSKYLADFVVYCSKREAAWQQYQINVADARRGNAIVNTHLNRMTVAGMAVNSRCGWARVRHICITRLTYQRSILVT